MVHDGDVPGLGQRLDKQRGEAGLVLGHQHPHAPSVAHLHEAGMKPPDLRPAGWAATAALSTETGFIGSSRWSAYRRQR